VIGKTISHYRILGQIGEGGMGVVYVAEDTLLGRRVAIKIPHAGRDEKHYRARFLREARSVSALSHKNIAAVFDLGKTDDGQPYIVMELVAGQTLGDLLAGPGLSLRRSVEIAGEVAEALSVAHKQQIVHRDIKPSNVIINERGEVKVLDFGLAKQLDEEFAQQATSGDAQSWLAARTRSDVVIGTPLYLSPEQARGADVDGRSDLFALGALLYECVAGRPAFSGSNVIEIGAQVLHFDPPPPSRFNQRVPAELDRLILKALAKRPEERFRNAEEMAAELRRVAARLPVSDTARTRRITSAENLIRSSALITIQRLRRPTVSPLVFIGVLAGAALLGLLAYYVIPRLRAHRPPQQALDLYDQGVEATREGEFYKASTYFDRAVKVDDAFSLAHARLAEAEMEMDFLERAQSEMIVADALETDSPQPSRDDALYFRAVRATVGHRPADAVKAYEELAESHPDRPEVQVDLGRAYDKNNETEKAVNAFSRAISRAPAYAAAFLNLGALYARLRNRAGAEAAFQTAESLYANNPEGLAEVHYQRGRFLSLLKKTEEARPELEKSLELARLTNNLYQQVQAMLFLSYNLDAEQGPATARSAIDLAQASGMNNLVAFGYIVLGNLYRDQGKFDDSESNLKRALELSRLYKVRYHEATALINLADVYSRQDRLDEASQAEAAAREFFQQAGYLRDAVTAVLQLARIKGRQGDYDGAVAALQEQVKVEEPTGDMQMLGQLRRELGSVLSKQGRFPESLSHYREALSIAKSLNDSTLMNFTTLNLASSLWRLGQDDEAAALLARLEESAAKLASPGKEDMLARVHLVRANMALSRERFDEAAAQGEQALKLAGDAGGVKDVRKDLIVEADATVCLAQSLGGSPARGHALCEEASRLASDAHNRDPWFVSFTQLALAQELLASGDARRAREEALRAEEFFAGSHHAESEWRALAVAGAASRRAGDERAAQDYLARAAASLSRLEQSWGADAAGYLARADVQRLRSGLGGDEAVAAGR
jgi:serine/threonine protein kinase/lipopolysaccharide biosynthesis regulator YciM